MSDLFQYIRLNRAVWNKAKDIPGQDSNGWRRTDCGRIIRRSHYANSESKHGWEVEYIVPVSRSDTADISNLRPCYWGS